jgi:hypothetical protein
VQLLAQLPSRLEELELRLSSRQLEVAEGGSGGLVEELADAVLASAPAASGAAGGAAEHRLRRLLCDRWLVFSRAAAERLMRGLSGLRSLQLCCSRVQPSSSRPLTAWQPELPPQVRVLPVPGGQRQQAAALNCVRASHAPAPR